MFVRNRQVMKRFILSIILSLFSIVSGNLNAQELSKLNHELFTIQKIYPNPISDFVFIEINAKNYISIQFELIDILGNKIKRWNKIEVVRGTQKVKLDFQSIHSGFYLLKISADKTNIVKRIRKL